MTERTEPPARPPLWALINGAWRSVCKAQPLLGSAVIVEDYEHPERAYEVDITNLRTGKKPTSPPAPHTGP